MLFELLVLGLNLDIEKSICASPWCRSEKLFVQIIIHSFHGLLEETEK